MLFNSFHFLIFFPAVTIVFFLLPFQHRWKWLLAVSCWFYMAFIPLYILILFLTISVDYFAAIKIENSSGRKRKIWFWSSIFSTLAILFIFKYFNFFLDNVYSVFYSNNNIENNWFLKIALPVGLSFHTFQSMAYVIEVYRNKFKPEKNFGIYSLYVMFYPQLVAGPIERPQNLLPQFTEKHEIDWKRIVEGLQRILWGFFKKICIADRLSVYIEKVFSADGNTGATDTWTAVILFSIQIYCDFSGYSDIAIGSAKVMGFRLIENFNLPYAATSIRNFWQRWHISLSTWFRDYIYISLGGNRKSNFRKFSNTLTTFILSGFWHGANWTFCLWGFVHGLFVSVSDNEKKTQNIYAKAIKIITVFLLVTLAWVLFRATSVSSALKIYSQLFHHIEFKIPFGKNFETMLDFALVLPFIIFMFFMEKKFGNNPLYVFTKNKNEKIQFAVSIAMIFVLLNFGSFLHAQQFIYFQF